MATFSGGDKYSLLLGCDLTDGTLGVQAEAGTYTATDDQFTTTAIKASCADATKVSTQGYAIKGSQLIVNTPDGATVFMMMSFPPSNGAFAYGCFGPNGFTPMPLAALP
jgi:hypothetical protein